MKNRLNLTIDEDLLVKVKKFASDSGVSLSSIVEKGLARAISQDENINIDKLLNDFHKKAHGKNFKEPSDILVKDLLQDRRQKKYS